MAKLRTMKYGTPILSSNHFKEQEKYFIPFGKFLRVFGFDELPQLYNILKGDMSFVGPRPLVLDDYETVNLRNAKKVNTIKPGLTGLAQINGRNDMSIPKKVYYDGIYLENMNMLLDMKIILLTNYYMFCENILHKNKDIINLIDKHSKAQLTMPKYCLKICNYVNECSQLLCSRHFSPFLPL
jgi:O-antigen biosynthesis protein WbqP